MGIDKEASKSRSPGQIETLGGAYHRFESTYRPHHKSAQQQRVPRRQSKQKKSLR